MKPLIYTLIFNLAVSLQFVTAQVLPPENSRNFELRNQDFVSRRESYPSENFARLYYEAYKQTLSSIQHYKTADQWTPLGPFGNERLNGIGRVNDFQVHPNDTNTWFICVAQGGVWKTTDAGASWRSISGDLPILRTSSIAIDPSNPQVMYVALGDYAYLGHNLLANENKRTSHYGLGIYKTINGGESWLPTGLSFAQLDFEGSLICRILINPSNSDLLVAVGQTGSYVSNNGGSSWQQTSQELFWDLDQDPYADSILYASTGYVHTYRIGQASVMKSTDFGRTWQVLDTKIPQTGLVQRIAIAISPTDNKYIYAIACDTLGGFYGFYRSTDGGDSFTMMADQSYKYNLLGTYLNKNPGGQGRYDLAISVDRSNKDHVLIGGVNMWHTNNGGETFDPLTFWRLNYDTLSLHADIHRIIQHPTNLTWFACHDGGLSRSYSLEHETVDSLIRNVVNTQWHDYTKGLNITSFYRLSINSKISGQLMAGAQDNSTVFKNTDSIYKNLSGGDGMESVFLDEQGYRFTSSQNGRIYVYSVDQSDMKFVGNISPPNNELGEWTTPFVSANKKLYVLYGNLYSYVGKYGAGLHSNFNDIPSRNYPLQGSALAVQKANANTIYVAKRGYNSQGVQNELWQSHDGGLTWDTMSKGLPRNLYPSSLEMNQEYTNEVWITFSGFDSLNKVFYSNNGGDDWINITFDLPNIPVNSIVLQPDRSGLVYIGTDVGVFFLRKNSTSWTYYSANLPKVIVSELQIDTAKQTLVAATFGRGIWEVGLVDYDSLALFIPGVSQLAVEVSLFPNPSSEFLNLEIESTNLGIYIFDIIDITGTSVLAGRLEINKSPQTFTYDLSKFRPGEYFIILKDGNRRVVKRFIKV